MQLCGLHFCFLQIPPSIKQLIGIDYHGGFKNDKFAPALKKLLDDGLEKRLRREKDQRGKQVHWIIEERGKEEREEMEKRQRRKFLSEKEKAKKKLNFKKMHDLALENQQEMEKEANLHGSQSTPGSLNKLGRSVQMSSHSGPALNRLHNHQAKTVLP